MALLKKGQGVSHVQGAESSLDMALTSIYLPQLRQRSNHIKGGQNFIKGIEVCVLCQSDLDQD